MRLASLWNSHGKLFSSLIAAKLRSRLGAMDPIGRWPADIPQKESRPRRVAHPDSSRSRGTTTSVKLSQKRTYNTIPSRQPDLPHQPVARRHFCIHLAQRNNRLPSDRSASNGSTAGARVDLPASSIRSVQFTGHFFPRDPLSQSLPFRRSDQIRQGEISSPHGTHSERPPAGGFF
jgi:hypothetical protein